MKLLLKIIAPVMLVIALAAAVAMATPVPPTSPYPNVPANPDVCKVEKIDVQKAQLNYDQAKADYERIKRLYERGAASISEVRNAERAMANTALALNNAKYAEAKCRNNLGADPKKACVDLSLELNRLIDELAQRQQLEAFARADYDAQLELQRRGATTPAAVEQARLAWQQAQLDRQRVEQQIADQRAKIAANPACRDFPSERPTPTSTTPPTSTPPSSTPPTSTPPSSTPPTSTPPTSTPPTSSPTSTTPPISTTVIPTSVTEAGSA
jgi:Outer membrane efflux protein